MVWMCPRNKTIIVSILNQFYNWHLNQKAFILFDELPWDLHLCQTKACYIIACYHKPNSQNCKVRPFAGL